jgi:hypothetical protein
MIAAMALAGPASADPIANQPPGATAINRALNGSGSVTTESVMYELTNVLSQLGSWGAGTATRLGVSEPYQITTTCTVNARILGSGAGRTALANSVSNNDGCFQFARSSSRSTSATPGTVNSSILGSTATYTGTGSTAVPLTPIAFAIDGLGYSFRTGSGTPRNLTLRELRTLYGGGVDPTTAVAPNLPYVQGPATNVLPVPCNFSGVSPDNRPLAAPSIPNQMLLPTNTSGSRGDWLSLMGLAASGQLYEVFSDIPVTNAGDDPTSASSPRNIPANTRMLRTCVDDGPGTTPATEFTEHDGRTLTNGRQIFPYSIAEWIAQGRGVDNIGQQITDIRSLALIGYIAPPAIGTAQPGSGAVPWQMYDNPAGALTPSTASNAATVDGAWFRTVYNVVPTAIAGNADVVAVFGTPGTGDIPTNNPLICQQDNLIVQNGFLPIC